MFNKTLFFYYVLLMLSAVGSLEHNLHNSDHCFNNATTFAPIGFANELLKSMGMYFRRGGY